MDFAFLAPIGFLLVRNDGIQTLLGDGDTGWHIRAGDWILQNGRVPTVDFFSYSKPGGRWFAWEWLWEAAFAWIEKTGGMAAVLFVTTLTICTSFAAVYLITKAKSGQALISLVVTLVAMCAASFHWLARPHIVTFLFVAVFYHLLDTGADKRKRMLIGLPLLTVVWTNLHGGFVAGLLVAAAFCGGELLRFLFLGGEERQEALGKAKLYGQALLLCGCATFVNPYFFELHRHIFSYIADGYQMEHIGEFQSVSFHHPAAFFFEILLLAGVAAGFWNVTKRNFTPALLIGGWGHLSLMSGRNIPIFAIVAAPIVAEAVGAWVAGLRRNQPAWIANAAAAFCSFCSEVNTFEAIPRFHPVSVAGVLAAGALMFAPNPPHRFQAQYDPATFPVDAVEELSRDHLAGRVFSTDIWSGYAIYRLYPQVRVFIDGRSDFYGPALDDLTNDILNVKSGWEDRLFQYHTETVLIPANSILSVAMMGSKRWRCIYDDGVAAVFRPSAGAA